MSESSKTKYLIASIILVVVLAGALVKQSFKKPLALGGLIHNTQESFDAGVAVGGTEVISSSRGVSAATLTVSGASTFTGDVTASGSFGTVSSTALRVNGKDSNDSIDFIGFASTTIDANSIGNGSATSASVTVTGAGTNDTVLVGMTGDWSAPSSSVRVFGSVTSANTVTLYFQNSSSSAVNLTSAQYNVHVLSPQ